MEKSRHLLRLVVLVATAAGSVSAQNDCDTKGLVEVFGQGTPGTAGTPSVTMGGAPLQGHPFQLAIVNALPGAHGCLLLGREKSPFDLGAFGATFYPGLPLVTDIFDVDGAGGSPPLVPLGAVSVALCGVELVAQAVVLDPATTSRIWSVRNDNDITSAIGLTYHGIWGAALVILELILVFASLIFAMRERLKLRRAGLVVLGVWSLLWLANALWMERLTGGDHAALTIPTAITTLIVLTFAALRWREKGSPRP